MEKLKHGDGIWVDGADDGAAGPGWAVYLELRKGRRVSVAAPGNEHCWGMYVHEMRAALTYGRDGTDTYDLWPEASGKAFLGPCGVVYYLKELQEMLAGESRFYDWFDGTRKDECEDYHLMAEALMAEGAI